jgi:hypothetical protein
VSAAETITVPSRFNGPQTSGNGGYTSGLLAARIGGAVEANLRSPVPLDVPLELSEDEEGALHLRDGEQPIAEARPAPDFDLAVPAPVGPEEARRAAANYRGLDDGLFSHCFVCGRAREDGFDVFAGRVEGRELAATPWTPPAWTAGADGQVQPEFVWAALDCPTSTATSVSACWSASAARSTPRSPPAKSTSSSPGRSSRTAASASPAPPSSPPRARPWLPATRC